MKRRVCYFILFLLACSSSTKTQVDPPPFEEGMYLQYRKGDSRSLFTMTFNRKSDGTWIGTAKSAGNVQTMSIDKAGYYSHRRRGKHFTKFWLPPQYRKPNASVSVMCPSEMSLDITVGEETKTWNGRTVWPASVKWHDESSTRYYDTATGWLVGIESEMTLIDDDLVLVDSNVGI
ncbi:MAG: hypothetical protein GF344_02750 [Chitinivibrionales bacterium]|nr:hypothetical protein [Chitinivibrionales bacterium]